MREKNIFQTVPEHEKRQLSRDFVDVALPCSRVEPQKERLDCQELLLTHEKRRLSRERKQKSGNENDFVRRSKLCFCMLAL